MAIPVRALAGNGAAGLLLVGAFVLDCVTGNEVSSSLFYMVGIGVAAWFAGRRAALVIAGLSAVAWGAAVRVVGPTFSKPSVFYLNLGAELVIYVAAAEFLSRIRRGLEQERRLIARLNAVTAELTRESRAVGDLQREMLPPGFPHVRGYEWQAHYATSSHSGGDYYDFFALPEGRLGVLVADASGHGAQAAVLMAMLRVLLHNASDPLLAPERVLDKLGRQIEGTVPAGRFATACYAVLDPATGRIAYSLAGHPPPLILRASGGLEDLPCAGGAPLGVCGELGFEAGECRLSQGDTLVLYTDGLTERAGPSQEFFGEERLHDAIRRPGRIPLRALRDRILESVAAHAAGVSAADDLTLLLLRRTR